MLIHRIPLVVHHQRSIEPQNAITISPAGGAAGHEFDRGDRYEGAASGAPTITIKSLLTPVQQAGVSAYGVGAIAALTSGLSPTLNPKQNQSSSPAPIRYASPERPVQQRYQSSDPRLLPDPSKLAGSSSPNARSNASPERHPPSHPATPNTPTKSRTPVGGGGAVTEAPADDEQHVSRRVRRRERAGLKDTPPPLISSSVPPAAGSGGGTPNSIRSRSKDSLTHANAAVFTHLVDDPDLQPDGPAIPYAPTIPNQLLYQQQQQLLLQQQNTAAAQQPPLQDPMRQYVQQPLLNRNQSPQTKIRATSLEAELNGTPTYARRNGLVNGGGAGIYRSKNYGNLATHTGDQHFETVYDTLPPPSVRTSAGMGQSPGPTPGIGPDHVGSVRMLEKGNNNVRNLETLVRRFESSPGESGFLNERQYRSQLTLGAGESPPSKYSRPSPGLSQGQSPGPSLSPNASPKLIRRGDSQRTTPGTQASQSSGQGLVGPESPRDLKRGVPLPRREGTLVRSIKGYDGSRFPNNFSNLTSEQRQLLISNAYGTGRVAAGRAGVPARLPVGERELSPLRDSRGGTLSGQLPPAAQYGGLSPNVSVFRRSKTNLDLTIDTIGAHLTGAHNPLLANSSMLKLDLQGNGIQAPGLVIAAARSRATSAAPPHSAAVRIGTSQQHPALSMSNDTTNGPQTAHPVAYTPSTNSTSNQSFGTANGLGGAAAANSPNGQPIGILKNLSSSIKRAPENSRNNSGSDKENNGVAGVNGGVTFLHKSASISRSSLRNGKGASTRTVSEERAAGGGAQAPDELPHIDESPLDKLNARLKASSQSNRLDEPSAAVISRERSQSRKTSKPLSVSFQIPTAVAAAAAADEKADAATAGGSGGGSLKKHLSSNALDGDFNDPDRALELDTAAAAAAAIVAATTLPISDRDRDKEREQRDRKSVSRQRRSEEAGASAAPEFSSSLLNLIIHGPRCVTPEDDFEEEVPSEDTPEKRERVARWLMGLRGVRLDTPPVQEAIETPTSMALLPEDTYIQSASRSNSFVQQLPTAQVYNLYGV